jgi:ribosomal protein S7
MKKVEENFDVKLAKSYIDKLTDEDKIRFLEILLDEIKPVFEIRGMAEDGGKYSEFELKSIKLTNRKKVSDGLNCLSAKVYQEDSCLIQYKNE